MNKFQSPLPPPDGHLFITELDSYSEVLGLQKKKGGGGCVKEKWPFLCFEQMKPPHQFFFLSTLPRPSLESLSEGEKTNKTAHVWNNLTPEVVTSL